MLPSDDELVLLLFCMQSGPKSKSLPLACLPYFGFVQKSYDVMIKKVEEICEEANRAAETTLVYIHHRDRSPHMALPFENGHFCAAHVPSHKTFLLRNRLVLQL